MTTKNIKAPLIDPEINMPSFEGGAEARDHTKFL
jgi:hypothetical protein